MELGTSTEWYLTSTSGRILIPAKDIVARHANVVGDQGRPRHTDDMVETGEEAQTLTAKGAGARFLIWHVTLLIPGRPEAAPHFPFFSPCFLGLYRPVLCYRQSSLIKSTCGRRPIHQLAVDTSQEAVSLLQL